MITCLFDEKSNCVTLRACGELGFLRTAQALQWALEMSPSARSMLIVLDDAVAVRSALELKSLVPVIHAWHERHSEITVAVVVPSLEDAAMIERALRCGASRFETIQCWLSEAEAVSALAAANDSASPLAVASPP